MNSVLETSPRFAVVGADAGYLGPGPPAPRGAGVLAVVGLLCVAVAVWAVGDRAPAGASAQDHSAGLARPVDVPTIQADEPDALLSGTTSYAPGQSSGWHRHPGLHLVTVKAGALTVYDQDCRAATYGPGQAYLGGDEPHLARNDTETTLDMAVTYLPWPGHSLEGYRVDEAPPPLCPVA